MIENINNVNLDTVNVFLTKNIEQLFFIFKNDETKIKTIKSINHKIKSIKNVNYLQKFIAECYNKIVDDIIDIKYKQTKIKNKLVGEYILTKKSCE